MYVTTISHLINCKFEGDKEDLSELVEAIER